jgi:hypothetical protein
MTRFTFDADVDAIRAALIEDILDDMSPDLIEAIIMAHEAEFMALARRYLAREWANGLDVWEEAHDRGYFTGDE